MQTMNSVEDLIADHPFLSALPPQLLDIFSDCASLRGFASGQQIFHEDGDADHFYLILSGQVALETFVPGCGMVAIQSLGPGEPLGWSWLFPPHQWHFSAATLKPTEVISFDAAALRKKAEAHLEFRAELLARITQTLVQRLQGTRMQLIDLYGMRP